MGRCSFTLLNQPGCISTNLMKTEEDREKLGARASYGLDPVTGTVITVTSANGQRCCAVNIGDLTPTEDGYYISVEDPNDNLYIVHSLLGGRTGTAAYGASLSRRGRLGNGSSGGIAASPGL